MNRLNIFWVILLVYVISFFLITATEVKHTSYYYELEPVNYNGYFVVSDEDRFIELGFVYNEEVQAYEILSWYPLDEGNITFYPYEVIGHYLVGLQMIGTSWYEYVHTKDMTRFFGFSRYVESGSEQIRVGVKVNESGTKTIYRIGTTYTLLSTYNIRIYGISNYEVES